MGAPATTASRTKKPRAKASKKSAKLAVADATLKGMPPRVVTFLVGVGTIPEVRAKLATRGYNATTHHEGWLLLDQVGGRASFAPPAAPSADDEAAGEAVDAAQQQIEAWATTNFAVASAALKHTHPAQHEYVFADGLKGAQGSAAVLATRTFLTRVERLGVKRRGAHPDDAKALALLGERGIGEAERERVRELIATVQEGKDAAPPAPAPAPPPPSTREAQLKLYAWYNEWTGITRAVIKRRDYLVRLGLATLRKRAKPA